MCFALWIFSGFAFKRDPDRTGAVIPAFRGRKRGSSVWREGDGRGRGEGGGGGEEGRSGGKRGEEEGERGGIQYIVNLADVIRFRVCPERRIS